MRSFFAGIPLVTIAVLAIWGVLFLESGLLRMLCLAIDGALSGWAAMSITLFVLDLWKTREQSEEVR